MPGFSSIYYPFTASLLPLYSIYSLIVVPQLFFCTTIIFPPYFLPLSVTLSSPVVISDPDPPPPPPPLTTSTQPVPSCVFPASYVPAISLLGSASHPSGGVHAPLFINQPSVCPPPVSDHVTICPSCLWSGDHIP
jgi:hypothetical protein